MNCIVDQTEELLEQIKILWSLLINELIFSTMAKFPWGVPFLLVSYVTTSLPIKQFASWNVFFNLETSMALNQIILVI